MQALRAKISRIERSRKNALPLRLLTTEGIVSPPNIEQSRMNLPAAISGVSMGNYLNAPGGGELNPRPPLVD